MSSTSADDYSKTIYCMNLKCRPDRWAETVEEVKKLGNDYRLIRYEAVEDRKNPVRGNAQTFLDLIRMAKKQKREAILIGEDDMVLCDESRDGWERAVDELPDNWDILLGGVYFIKGKEDITPHLCKITDFCALHFIMVRRSAYDLVLNYEKNNYGFRNIDRYIGRLGVTGKLNVYLAWPMISSQRAGYSDLRKKEVDDNKTNKKKGLVFLTEN
jgi:hypothetical protein